MISFIIKRLLQAVLTTIVVSMVSFMIIKLPPGDFVTSYIAQMAGSGSYVTQQEAQNLRDYYGLNQPTYVQYFKWISRLVRGDFGVSMEYNRPVAAVIGDRLWLTVAVSLAAIIITWIVALPIGIFTAVRQHSFYDYFFTFLAFIGLSIPNFLLALILMYFGYSAFNLSVGGLFSPQFLQASWSLAKLWDLLKHMPLPAVVLSLAGTAELVRIMRASLLDELKRPYVLTARAKGLSKTRAILKYPVRAALNPFASTIGYLLPFIVSGSIIVSVVLSLPTVGPLLLQSLLSQDMYLAGTIVLLLGIMTIVGTLLSDLLLLWLDPRMRLEGNK